MLILDSLILLPCFSSLIPQIRSFMVFLKKHHLDFLGGTVDKNPAACTGDTGLSPCRARAGELPGPCATPPSPRAAVTEAQTPRPALRNKRSHHVGKPEHGNEE